MANPYSDIINAPELLMGSTWHPGGTAAASHTSEAHNWLLATELALPYGWYWVNILCLGLLV